jgi:hypothetical protein
MACKNKERSVDGIGESAPPPAQKGPDLGLPIKIIEAPTDNWVTIDTLVNSSGKQMSIGNMYLNNVSRAMYKTAFGYLLEGDLPDGCSTLHSVELEFDGDTVMINARSQRDPSAMCTQALVPFSYFAPISDDESFTSAKRWKSGETAANIQ